jgi:protein involved in polysaccharide export with SLBB domain
MIREKAIWLLAVMMCLGFSAAACSSKKMNVSPEPIAAPQDNDYRLGTGDQLHVIVYGHEDLSPEMVQVDSAGRISLPLVGDLLVVGHTPNEVQKMIVEALSPDYLANPVVSVDVIKYRDFYIIGEVANPGPYPYVGGMRAINAVATAGGFTYRAVQDEFVISRNGEQIQGGQGTPIYPGDVIEVRERFF